MTERSRSRSSREEPETRSRGRDREEPARGRSRDDEESPRHSSRDRDEAPARGRGRSESSYTYESRSAKSTRERASKGANDYDKLMVDGVKMWKPNDGDNSIRILPPTWKKAQHYGLDIYVHYGVGADRGHYLCLHKMKGEADPIHEEYVRAKAEIDPENKEDAKYLKDLEAKRRVLVYLIDRDHEKEGVQCWAMPWTVDRDIVKVSIDKKSGEVLPIDHPEDGYDVEFEKKGSKDRTEYLGVAIARRSSPLGNDDWLQHAVDNPLPEQLRYFDYDHIAKAFGGGSAKAKSRDDEDEAPRRGSNERDAAPTRGRDRDEVKEPDYTWEGIHEMTGKELDNLIEDEKLDINPDEAKDDEDLADWICEEMKIKKSEKQARRKVSEPEDDPADRLANLRRSRRD